MDHNGATQDNRSGMHHGSMARTTTAQEDKAASNIHHLSRGISPSAKATASREERIQCSLPSPEGSLAFATEECAQAHGAVSQKWTDGVCRGRVSNDDASRFSNHQDASLASRTWIVSSHLIWLS